MLRIVVILFFRSLNALRRGKFTNNIRNCAYYFVLMLALIYYNCIIRSAINVTRDILSKELDLEDLIENTEIPIVDYDEDASEVKTQQLPSAYIIGAPRCGTTALTDFLQIHPDVQIVPSEVHYFDKFFSNGIDWYKSNMPLCNKYQIVIERCPSYLINPVVPERLFKARPNAKIILGVRDPTQRAISEYADLEKKEAKGKFYKPFREFAFDQGNLGKMNSNWTVLTTGFYAEHLQPWLKFFPMDRIFIYSAEDLAADPAKILKDLQIFLQLRYYVNPGHFKINGTGPFPCILDPKDSDQVCLNDTMKAVHLNHTVVEWSITNNLKSFYLSKIKDFNNLTGRNFIWDQPLNPSIPFNH